MKLLSLAGRTQWRILFSVVVLLVAVPAVAEVAPDQPAKLSVSEIVQRMQQHDRTQQQQLESYHALRHYSVEYRSFFKNLSATMDVVIDYSAGSGKHFQIVSQSGSHLLCDKVLKRAVQSEQEASLDKADHALTEVNYKFHLAGVGLADGRPAYILDVEPITKSKFLYKGKIWVDAKDFAVAKLEVEPAVSPSFWISRTSILHANAETNGVWLPAHNRSETKVRLGGKAVFTIDYGTYQVVSKR